MGDTSTGIFVPVQYKDADGNWRVKISQMRDGINDVRRQQVYLEHLAAHGRNTDACLAAGVSAVAVNRFRRADNDFDEACIAAVGQYTDRLIAHHQKLVFEGTTKTSYGRDGSIVSEEQIFPIRLIELELKKHDEGYREKREVDLKVSGGVLVAPADTKTIDDWEARFSGETIEGEVVPAQEVEAEA